MSVIRKLPYIDGIIKNLDSDTLDALKYYVNNSDDVVERAFDDLPEEDVEPVYFKLAENNFKTGIYVKVSDDKAVLIAYHRFQDLALFELDLNTHNFKRIDEYCDINELRRLLVDVGTIAPETLVNSIEGGEGIVVDVNEGGDKAEIHLDAEVVSKVERSLVTPLTAPLETEIVGIDDGNSQVRIKLGADFIIEDGVLKLAS